MAMAGSWHVRGRCGRGRAKTYNSERTFYPHRPSSHRRHVIDLGRRVDHTVSGANAMSSVEDRIRSEIEGHPIVLFMKGTPQFPMCGFSSRSVQALKAAGAQLHTV